MDGDKNNKISKEELDVIFEHPIKTQILTAAQAVLGKIRVWTAYFACFWYKEMIDHPQNNLSGIYSFFHKLHLFFYEKKLPNEKRRITIHLSKTNKKEDR